MAKFLKITVNSVIRTFTAENIITTERTAATTTVITFNHAQAGFDTLTLTHATDAAYTYPNNVVGILDTAILSVHAGERKPDVYTTVTLPVAVSTAVFS